MPVEKPFVKPSTSVIKRLFDFSDRNETKQMLEEMLLAESMRLRSLWNFAPKIDVAAGETLDEIPMHKKRFAKWERQDRKDVPHYYSRPFHRHQSDEHHSLSRDLLRETASQSIPTPLSSRNENLIQHCKHKRNTVKSTPMFASPPRISSETVNPSLVRFVSALRVPLPTVGTQTKSVVDENKPKQRIDCASGVKQDVVHETPKHQAFRQLFEEKRSRKRTCASASTLQPKITGWCLFSCGFVMITFCNVAIPEYLRKLNKVQPADLSCRNFGNALA